MFTMAKVIMFPQKKRIPKGMEEAIHKAAKNYVEVLQATMVLMTIDDPDLESYDEIYEMVIETYAEGLIKAIDEIGEQL